MAITKRDPNTIYLAGPAPGTGGWIVNDVPAGAAITPGQLIEMYDASGTLSWRRNSSATNMPTLAVALDQSEYNLGVDDDYAANDLVKAAFLCHGAVFWGLVPSGQDITQGDYLQSNGDGNLKEATSVTAGDNVAQFQALETLGAVTALTRLRVQVI